MWKLLYFSVTQILREVSFRDSRNAKYAILIHLETLNFDLYEFVHLSKAEIFQSNKIQRLENGKTAVLEFLESHKLISRKI